MKSNRRVGGKVRKNDLKRLIYDTILKHITVFSIIDFEEKLMTAEILHVCIVCKHIHDKEKEGNWEQLPEDFQCPECGCNKDEYYDELWYQV